MMRKHFIFNLKIINFCKLILDSSVDESLIKYVVDRKGHDRRYGVDPTKIKEELGWYPETKFEDGIIKIIKWYLENQRMDEKCDIRRIPEIL
jgi:dTDP-glucose 4,6-dehydratase (EC 4.2.1.46)